ncbi:MAG: hypothetical protein ABI672_19985 [Vicinamibacteria bacterium]
MNIKKPNRVSRTFTQHLVAGSDRVFPLLCPVREADWIEGWDPIVVLSESGLAEPDCVFMTPGPTTPALWFITRHEPTDGYVEMIKITPDVTACRLTIQLTSSDSACEATITYAHTSLGPQGDAFVAGFTEEFYEQFMRDWEARMNHYLKTGQKLTTS